MRRVLCLVLLCILVACSAVERPVDTKSQSGVLQLSYGACFGTCPIFKVSLDASGSLTFEGDRHVFAKGRHQRSVGSQTYIAAVRLIENMPETELSDPLQCPRRHSDSHTVRGSLRSPDQIVNFHHYYGCGGYEWRTRQQQFIRELTNLLEIDDLVGWDTNRRR